MIERRKSNSRMTANLSPSLPQTPNGGCSGGCNSSNPIPSANCKALLAKLQRLDFSLVDTVLYLDAYPECQEALAHYHQLLGERNALCEQLAKVCKMPITNFENASRDTWDWTRGPWPWESDAN